MDLAGRGVTVFCASSRNVAQVYRDAAAELGLALAARDATVVFGGGSIGLMGVLADAALDAGGRVIGVIPRDLETAELAHEGVTELIVVDTMHERKALMSEHAAAYLVLPGGFGTYEEFFEVVTWKQLGMHVKPIVLVNVNGYFNQLLAQFEHAVNEKFVRRYNSELFEVAQSIDEALALLEAHETPSKALEKWY